MDIRVLGPLELVGTEGPLPLAAPMQRRLLAALVTRAGDTLSADALIDTLWGEAPPASAAKVLQTYVSQLRKTLPEGARIVTRGAGYALELENASLDAGRFELLLEEGRKAVREGNPALGASLLRRALALWRGQAYGEFAYDEFARGEAERLEELRLVAIEERFGAELALGRHAELLPELQSLARLQPLRERLQAQAMLALYRCGRQTEALDLYATVRATLRDELGLEPGQELRALQQRILKHDPALAVARAAEESRSILPAPPNALVGRRDELAELCRLLVREQVRLLVLTGAGGSGKTRLALEAAHETALSFANGAAFVDLAPLRDPELVVGTISRALAISDVAGQEPLDTLVAALRPLEVLLVVDNAEHLRAASPLFVALLARAPRLTLLVTSRVVLHLSGEHVYPVEPLAEKAAVALFHERAHEAEPRFHPSAADEDAILHICQRLDGLPLAIELAATRVRTLIPTELLARLEPRLPLLRSGPRDLPARQKTLRATLEWSYDLLDKSEQRDLVRLAVFAGGCTLEAAEAVCGTTLERLGSLVDHNLLKRAITAGGSRYTMLETIREYALERLDRAPDADDVRRRHAEFFLATAESANLNAAKLDVQKPMRHDVALAEQENIRAALAWSLASGSVALGLELAAWMEWFWIMHDPHEGIRWFAGLLEHPRAESVAPGIRADALRAYGSSTDIAGRDEDAARLYRESLALFEQLRDEHGRAVLLHRLGIQAMRRGELERARELVEASHKIHERRDDRWGQCQTVGTLGAIARDAADDTTASALIGQSRAIARELGVPWWESGMLAELACLSLNAGRIEDAEMHARESLSLAEQLHDRPGRVFGVGLLAALAAERGEHARAGHLWGAIENEDAVAPLGGWRRHRRTLEARIRRAAGQEFERGQAESRSRTNDDVVSLALDPP